MLAVHVSSMGKTFDSRMRTTCQMGTSYRPSTKDRRNSARSATASPTIHSAARRSAAVRCGVCFMGGSLLPVIFSIIPLINKDKHVLADQWYFTALFFFAQYGDVRYGRIFVRG